MKRLFSKLNVYLGRVNRRHIQLLILLITLILFAIGAGAPDGGSGLGGPG